MIAKLNTFLADNRVEMVCRWIVGGVFVFASIDKMMKPADFAMIIYGYGLFPQLSINLIAIIVPYLEFFAGLALILGFYPRSAGLILSAMLLAFSIAISINLIRGHEFDCGCFSVDSASHATSAVSLLVRDILLLLAGVQVLLFKGNRRLSLNNR